MPGRARILLGADLPPRLRDLPKPPESVHLHGELPRGPAVAIVGTRRPSPRGVRFTEDLASALARRGVAVLSGGAKGIDTAAHRGTLAAGGITVVVAPAGLDHPFPKENAALFKQIIDSGGAYLSLVTDGRPATRSIFFQRNSSRYRMSSSSRSHPCRAARATPPSGRASSVVRCSRFRSLPGSGGVAVPSSSSVLAPAFARVRATS
jgi:predicted Rossmann fold nucleotide-binding protein DprA/Smf involved in DNA uptake